MTAHIPPEQLALYAGGDLHPAEMRSVQLHLDQCTHCRRLAASLAGAIAFTHIAGLQPLEQDFGTVRTAVLQSIPTKAVFRRKPWLIAGLSATSSLAAGILLLSRVPHTQPEVPKVTVALPPALTLPLPRPVLLQPVLRTAFRPARPPKAGVRSLQLTTANDGSGVLRMTTADPNVVVLLSFPKQEEISREN